MCARTQFSIFNFYQLEGKWNVVYAYSVVQPNFCSVCTHFRRIAASVCKIFCLQANTHLHNKEAGCEHNSVPAIIIYHSMGTYITWLHWGRMHGSKST